MTLRNAASLTLLLALAALGIAYFAQDALQLAPCPLCLWERWPYRFTAVLGLAGIVMPRAGRVFLALAALVMLGGAAIAFVHIGVEHGWWPSPLPECNGTLTPGAPLPMIPAIPCDRPVYLIAHLPISMATMDFCTALAFGLGLALYVSRKSRRIK